MQNDLGIRLAVEGLNRYEADLNSASNATKKAAGGMSDALKNLGAMMAQVLGPAAMAAFGKASVQKFADFEQSLNSLSAITGATGQDLEYFNNQAKEIGKTTTIGATDAVKAFELIGSAMPVLLSDKKGLSAVTKEAIKLAEASGMALPDAAASAVGALNQYGAAASEASRFVNVLAAGALQGASPIQASTQALEQFGSTAKGFNVSIEESIGLVQTLADKNIMGAESGTALRNVLLKMQTAKALDPKALADLSRLGVDLGKVTDATIPVSERLREMGKIGGDATAMMHVFGLENINAANILLGNTQRFDDLTKAITGTNAATTQQAIQTAGLAASWTKIMNQIDIMMIEVGASLKPVLDDIIKGWNPAFKEAKSIVELFLTPLRGIIPILKGVSSLFGGASSEGSTFAGVIKMIGFWFKWTLLPVQLLWKAVGKVVELFQWGKEKVASFTNEFPIMKKAIEVLTLPLRLLIDGLSWVGEKLGIIEHEGSANMTMYNNMVKGLAGIGKEAGATGAQMSAFVKQLDMTHYAGLSTADQIKLLKIELFNFLHPGDAATKTVNDLTDAFGKNTDAAGGTKKAIEELGYGYRGMAEPYLLKAAMDHVNAEKERATALRESAKAAQDLLDVDQMNAEAGEDPMVTAMNDRVKALKVSANGMKDIFKDLSVQVKGQMASMAGDVAFSIGEAIGSGGSVAEVMKAALRDLAVQIPKMAGMALLNAATNPLNSTIALPLVVTGLALLGASGIASGLFKAADKRNEARVANNSGAAASTNSDTGQATGFASVIGDQIANSMDGRRLVLQVGDQEMDAYVYDSNRRNAESRGR